MSKFIPGTWVHEPKKTKEVKKEIKEKTPEENKKVDKKESK